MELAYASLAHIRILLVPVNPISPEAFNKWSSQLQEFTEIRLSDIPADSRDERARFMPNPLASGSLLLSFSKHPPPSSHSIFDLFRPSDFPLGIVGISSCSHSDTLSSIYSNFNAALSELSTSQSPFPLARNCFVFEEGDGNTNLNIGNHLPGLFVIPSMMGNKKIYLGTLLAELCSTILGEFSVIIRMLESPTGNDALGAGLFGRAPNARLSRPSHESGEPERPFSVAGIPKAREQDPRSNIRRASTMGPGVTPSSSLSATSVMSKKRISTINGGGTAHARLYKVLGDLFLMSGRTMDASIWYNEAVHGLRHPQDAVWIASAYEGIAVAVLIESWASSHATANDVTADAWRDCADKLSKAVQHYDQAADEFESEGSIAEIAYLYVTASLRLATLMYYIWLCDGLGTSAFEGLLHGKLDGAIARASRKITGQNANEDDSYTVSRSDVASSVSQAHGPWLLHLVSRERISCLKYMATIYASLGFRRKETYILRELLACLLDLLVQGREEARTFSETVIGLAKSPNSATSNSDVVVRGKDNTVGNESILRLQQYICEVHGLDLGCVDFNVESENEGARPAIPVLSTVANRGTLTYIWPELQVGLLRESLEIAEALPDYTAITRFSLSALRSAHHLLDSEEHFRFHTAAARAMATLRRRGDARKFQFWPEQIVSGLQFIPLPFAKVPVERKWSDLELRRARKSRGFVPDWLNFGSRRVTITKRNAYAVCNEPLEFVVTFDNPYAITLDIVSVSLCTSGVEFTGISSPVVVQGSSIASITLTGKSSEAGLLVVRGCLVELPGLVRHEVLLPVFTEEEEQNHHFESLAKINLEEKQKSTCLSDRLQRVREQKRLSMQGAPSNKALPKYLEIQIVPEQPVLRVRRTSLTNGAVMLYDGEISPIRITLENISSLPVDFLELTFEDSTRIYFEQLINAEEPNLFDTYEAEYALVRKPVLSWDQEDEREGVEAGQERTIMVQCFGKAGCTDGTIYISYSCTRKLHEKPQTPPPAFYTRQLVLPILISVYQMLECSGMNIIPISDFEVGSAGRREWDQLFREVERDDWCLFALDVQNTYGLPFEVTLTFDSSISSSRVIPPGSTYKLLLPIKRFSVTLSKAQLPIPSLTGRQFVVSKMGIVQEMMTRQLFWYREELLQRLKVSWREASGTRFGELSLRKQRFTQHMLRALQTDRVRVKLNVEELGNGLEPEGSRRASRSYIQPDAHISVTAVVQNLTDEPLALALSLSTDPSDHFIVHGVSRDIPLGVVAPNESRMHSATAVFVSAGRFTVTGEVFGYTEMQRDETLCGRGLIKVSVRTMEHG